MRDLVVLAGGYGLDSMSASAVRAFGLAHLIEKLGYRVILMGKFRDAPGEARSPDGKVINGIVCRDISQPVSGRPAKWYVRSADPVMQVVDEQGAGRVRALVCYNYPARGAIALLFRAWSRGIVPILDCTEWYGWEGKKVLRNIWRLAGVAVRMHLLTRLSGNVICASSWFQAKLPGVNTLVLPFALDTTRPEWQRNAVGNLEAPVHLVYSGSPGMGMHKDRLPVMIDALARLASAGHEFRVSIAGMTKAQYLEILPSHATCISTLAERLRFLGRIPHEESLALLRTADFSVFFREPNRVSNTGFSTKFVEAMTLGVPVISNATSDIPRYLHDGQNGILAQSIAEEDVADALHRAVTMSRDEREAMIAACRADNPFDLSEWEADVRGFLEHLRGSND